MGAIRTFSIAEAADLSGLKKPMIDYLCRSEIIKPSGNRKTGRGRGKPRLFTFSDIVMLRVVAKLLDKGVSVKRIKQALKRLAKKEGEWAKEASEMKYFITDGTEIYLKAKDNIVETLTQNGQLEFAFVIDLGGIQENIHADLAETG